MTSRKIISWLNTQIDYEDSQADDHANMSEEFRRAKEHYKKTGHLPREIRKEMHPNSLRNQS